MNSIEGIKLNCIINKYIKAYKDFTYHINESEFGFCIYIMKTDGKVFCTATIRTPSDETLQIDLISVNDEIRNQYYGNQCLNLFTMIAKSLKLKYIRLITKKDSWQEAWYKRNDYKYSNVVEDNLDYVWLIKELSY